MKAAEMRGLGDKEVLEQITTFRRELFGLRFQHATGELENTAGLRSAKRERGLDPDNPNAGAQTDG
jgi:large subunit ribosomal protein L29